MTLMIELPDDVAARLSKAGIPVEEASRYAMATLVDIAARSEADAEEIKTWWESLSEEAREGERQKTKKSLADVDAGRVSGAAEVYARVRASRANRPA